jgi:DNA polymerase I-like protein with 3'-5' exonuclease and polymerase domains
MSACGIKDPKQLTFTTFRACKKMHDLESDFAELERANKHLNIQDLWREDIEATLSSTTPVGKRVQILEAMSEYAEAFNWRFEHLRGAMLSPQGNAQLVSSTTGFVWQQASRDERCREEIKKLAATAAANSNALFLDRVKSTLEKYGLNAEPMDLLVKYRSLMKCLALFEKDRLFDVSSSAKASIVHGELSHVSTSTGRLASRSPNIQNIPKASDVRKLFTSRFRGGVLLEADYSQLEVVALAALSGDTKMKQQIKDRVDFHCLRVSLITREPYDVIVRKVKQEKDPNYIAMRQNAKVFSFQRQYGAGAATIAATTGLPLKEVEALIKAEEEYYPQLAHFYRLIENCVSQMSRSLLRYQGNSANWTPENVDAVVRTEPLRYFITPTGAKYDFTNDYQSIPKLKNHCVQGFAAELVQLVLGKLCRHFYGTSNYNGRALLVNTVHDSVWIDVHAEIAEEVSSDVKSIMESLPAAVGSIWGGSVPIDVPFEVTIEVGQNLAEMKPLVFSSAKK